MSHVVIFDQGNKEKPFEVITESKFKEMKDVMDRVGYVQKWLYTDLFTGSEEQCEEFIDNHKLRR